LVNNGNQLILESTGTLTLPSGGTITEGYVTSNPTIQLTPASPSVASQKLVIKGGGTYNYTDNGININYYVNTAQVGDTLTFSVYSDTYADQTLYWWIYPENAGIGDTESGTVVLTGTGGEFTILIDSDAYEFTVRVSPENNNYDPANTGVESGLINADEPTFEGDHHLHLTTGNLEVTSIFLGTDDHNVRTTTDGKIQITTPSQVNNVWEFGTDGSLTIPGNIKSDSNINIDINLEDSTLHRWQFGEDGNLTFPTGMTMGDLGSAQGIQGSVDTPVGILSQGTGGTSVLQWVDDFEEATAVAAVVVNSLFAPNTGTVQILTGDVGPVPEYSWTFGPDGDLTLPDGGPIWFGGNNCKIQALQGFSISSDGGIVVEVTDKQWQFGPDGSITFPDGTEQTTAAAPAFSFSVAADDSTQRLISNNESIKFIGAGKINTASDAEGNITITGADSEGSWTVTTGTNTYSFTVPMDGTYVMWVKGNIPNGIITWNATLSVTNSNVPAIGYQYAWNYTGGGSPILLTSIPDQIRGTAGTISTDATYVGSTSNRFDFGINNTSGASQTVYYGYTRV
jgi:hypothetical protein